MGKILRAEIKLIDGDLYLTKVYVDGRCNAHGFSLTDRAIRSFKTMALGEIDRLVDEERQQREKTGGAA